MNIWHDIDPGRIGTESFVAVVEIAKGGKNKYELDKATGMLMLDRVLFTSTHYPASYGFIPRTCADDHDPLDVLILCQEEILPMTLVECKPIGVIKMIDEKESDEKIIAVPLHDPEFVWLNDIANVAPHVLEEISHFFTVYKSLEKKTTFVKEIQGHEEAKRIIATCIDAYNKQFPGK